MTAADGSVIELAMNSTRNSGLFAGAEWIRTLGPVEVAGSGVPLICRTKVVFGFRSF